jgi:methionine sulfoxide reductase heme-binding subunit
MTSLPARNEGEDLLDQAVPTALHFVIPAVALVMDIAFIAGQFSSQTTWYMIRASGIVAYVLLTLSVISGLLITNRVLPSGQPRVDAFEVHNFTALLTLAFTSVHVVGLLLDAYIGFSVVQIVVPFLSGFRPLAVSAGILGIYITAVVYASLWFRRRIGYKTWRTLHYGSFGAYALVTLHGLFAGTDTGVAWMIPVYAASVVLVAAFTTRRAMQAHAV